VGHIGTYQYQVFFKIVLHAIANIPYSLAAENVGKLKFGMIMPGVIELFAIVLNDGFE
jgi:hypothetical protein